MASSSPVESATTDIVATVAVASTAPTASVKTTVFSPDDIKKIGLDKIINNDVTTKSSKTLSPTETVEDKTEKIDECKSEEEMKQVEGKLDDKTEKVDEDKLVDDSEKIHEDAKVENVEEGNAAQEVEEDKVIEKDKDNEECKQVEGEKDIDEEKDLEEPKDIEVQKNIEEQEEAVEEADDNEEHKEVQPETAEEEHIEEAKDGVEEGDAVSEDSNDVKEVVETPVSPKTQITFRNNLKLNMQRVLQDKKITIVAKKKAQQLVIIKRPNPDVVEGKKIRVMQNRIIHVQKKVDAVDSVNGKTLKLVGKTVAKPVVKKASAFDFDDGDEGASPVFKASPMRTYKRKRNDGQDTSEKKIVIVPAVKKIEVKEVAATVPQQIPKKRIPLRKTELAEQKIEFYDDDDVDDDLDEEQLEEESDSEEIIIVQVPDKTKQTELVVDDGDEDDDEDDEEEIHFITDKDADDSDSEDPQRKMMKKYDGKTQAEIIQAIKKKRGRRSKAELELLAKWDKETKIKKKKSDESDDEDKEDNDEDDEEDEEDESQVEKIIMSPTRTGRVPKRNKLFDNFVTGSRAARKPSTSDSETPKVQKTQPQTPKVVDGETPTPKRRGRPPKNKAVETPKPTPVEEVPEEKSEVKEVQSVTQDEKSEAVHVTGDSEVIVIPKKRGRPAPVKKVETVKAVSEKSESEEEKDEELIVKKPRGRQASKTEVEEVKNGSDPKEKTNTEEEVVLPRRGRTAARKTVDEPKVKSTSRGRKRKMAERQESPSTSAADDGVDEPSKRQKVETLNEPVADLGATPKEEGATTKMYRLLVANLVVNVRERMAAAQDQPKGYVNQHQIILSNKLIVILDLVKLKHAPFVNSIVRRPSGMRTYNANIITLHGKHHKNHWYQYYHYCSKKY